MSQCVTINTYHGPWEDLARFVQRVWTHDYAGRMTFPGWTGEYLQWQLGEPPERHNLLGAFVDDTLAGVLLGTDRKMRTPVGGLAASQWSWLSVDPQYRGMGIARMLDEERVRRQRDQDGELIVSYRYVGSRHSQAERPTAQTRFKKFHAKLGFWARILDPDRFAQWHYNTFEGQLARWARGLMPRIPLSAERPIRPATPDDLAPCVELLRTCSSAMSLSIDWDVDSLRQQLFGSPLSQSLVMRDQDRIIGLINYHQLPFHARTVENVAVIDILAFLPQSHRSMITLLQATLAQMRDQGVILALKLRSGDTPAWPLLRTGFVPQPADSYLVLQWLREPVELSRRSPMRLLWR
ncbi:MAG: GNAT family N-acetyltransferase [Planctomycetota bacterium]|nr:MAG: GNAT family N-acetyltransferase [Planctomycetota bacterium]